MEFESFDRDESKNPSFFAFVVRGISFAPGSSRMGGFGVNGSLATCGTRTLRVSASLPELLACSRSRFVARVACQ
jgi:hypothetical protein